MFGSSDSEVQDLSGHRYGALKIIIVLQKVAAVIVLLFGAIALISSVTSSENAAVAFAWGAMLTSIVFALGLWGSAEIFQLLIDIETNTRK